MRVATMHRRNFLFSFGALLQCAPCGGLVVHEHQPDALETEAFDDEPHAWPGTCADPSSSVVGNCSIDSHSKFDDVKGGGPWDLKDPSYDIKNETVPFWMCKKYPPWQSPSSKPEQAVAIVFRGGTFRGGHVRGGEKPPTGLPATFKDQRLAWDSHQKYIVDPLESEGYKVDVFSVSYEINTTANFSFRDVFAKNLRNESVTRGIGSQGRNAWDAMLALALYAERHRVSYRYVVLTRHDNIISQNLAPLIKSDNKLIVTSYHEFSKDPYCQSLNWAPDFLFAFPGQFIGCC